MSIHRSNISTAVFGVLRFTTWSQEWCWCQASQWETASGCRSAESVEITGQLVLHICCCCHCV